MNSHDNHTSLKTPDNRGQLSPQDRPSAATAGDPHSRSRIALVINQLDQLLYAALKRLLIFPIKVYQITLSPLIGGQCRHWPTCSHYAIQAIERHGPFYGLWLAVWRIVRCNPFFRGGVDPVPPVRAKK